MYNKVDVYFYKYIFSNTNKDSLCNLWSIFIIHNCEYIVSHKYSNIMDLI